MAYDLKILPTPRSLLYSLLFLPQDLLFQQGHIWSGGLIINKMIMTIISVRPWVIFWKATRVRGKQTFSFTVLEAKIKRKSAWGKKKDVPTVVPPLSWLRFLLPCLDRNLGYSRGSSSLVILEEVHHSLSLPAFILHLAGMIGHPKWPVEPSGPQSPCKSQVGKVELSGSQTPCRPQIG